jgi:TetR/AcrR family transcriptional repressor of nem operon
MRYSPEHKTDTRRRIVDVASKAFRQHGAAGVSVSKIMADAGLTVGGFYRHFQSKDELFGAALDKALGETLNLLRKSDRDSRLDGDEWLERAAAVYLSAAHRNLRDAGCPLPTLTAEVGRRGEDVRRTFGNSVQALVEEIATRIEPGNADAGRQRAWGFLATLVGSLLLARGVADESLAVEILSAGRTAAAPEIVSDEHGS